VVTRSLAGIWSRLVVLLLDVALPWSEPETMRRWAAGPPKINGLFILQIGGSRLRYGNPPLYVRGDLERGDP
jgi:hypothetical protein